MILELREMSKNGYGLGIISQSLHSISEIANLRHIGLFGQEIV